VNKNLDYHLILNEAPDAIFIVNKKLDIIEVNKSASELSGYDKTELLKMSLPVLFTEKELQNKPFDINGIESNEIIFLERKIRTKQGKIIPVEMKSRKLPDGNYYSSIRDISLRIKTRDDIQESLNKVKFSEFKYRNLFNNIPLGIFTVQSNGSIESINQSMVKILGSPSVEKSLKFNLFELPTLKGTELLKDLNSCFEHGKSFQKIYDYTSVWDKNAFVKAHILPAEKESSEKVLVIIEDYTVQKEKELQLKIAKEKAEEADLLKSSFLANMSHEIRTPLNAIMGFSSLISDYDIDSDDSVKFIDIIQTNSKQLLNVIDDVLLVAKLQVKQVKVYSSVFLIDQLLQELYSNFNKEIKLFIEKEVEIKLEIYENERIEKLETDKVKLNQILNKLIRNAIKFTSKGTISFGYEIRDNNELVFFVKDTGVGISQDKQKIIFQKFRQADDSSTRQFGGTGLGLSIVKGLIDLLEGNLWIESEESKGANFYFTIPLEIIKKKKNKTNKSKLKWEKKTILVVDDVSESILLIEEILRPSGINIITASNGIEAIEKFKLHTNIDLILMDIQLPKLNGLVAAKRIKAIKDIPIIAQSAYLQQEYEKQCKALGCNEFIQKPINADELVLKIENYI